MMPPVACGILTAGREMGNIGNVIPAQAGSGQSEFGVPRLRGSDGSLPPEGGTPNGDNSGTRAHVYSYGDIRSWRAKRGNLQITDVNCPAGDDCGWVDCVQWTNPLPQDPPSDQWMTLTYTYDAAGRRIEKKYDGLTVLKYVYDGDQCIAEYDAGSNLRRKYLYGPCIDEPICMIETTVSPSATYYYHFDGLGSVTALTNASGNTVEVYEYDVYGRVGASDANHPNRLMFTGREYDKETGLYYYRARYYNPQIGRFLQTDPVGYQAGMNWYGYCGNNPLTYVDPSGAIVVLPPAMLPLPQIGKSDAIGQALMWHYLTGGGSPFWVPWSYVCGDEGAMAGMKKFIYDVADFVRAAWEMGYSGTCFVGKQNMQFIAPPIADMFTGRALINGFEMTESLSWSDYTLEPVDTPDKDDPSRWQWKVTIEASVQFSLSDTADLHPLRHLLPDGPAWYLAGLYNWWPPRIVANWLTGKAPKAQPFSVFSNSPLARVTIWWYTDKTGVQVVFHDWLAEGN
jgi:RHS repeat-associated protein